jgi:hypothetical protein
MNKTKALTHEQLMAKALASYTQQVIQEERRRQAIREGRLPAPVCQSETWNISDRH